MEKTTMAPHFKRVQILDLVQGPRSLLAYVWVNEKHNMIYKTVQHVVFTLIAAQICSISTLVPTHLILHSSV